uniref:Uncharacterized protein n=1 Tax=Lepeophtheirus salmonis TaxID=72036 RepID=A0A0K2SXY2_LEPSM
MELRSFEKGQKRASGKKKERYHPSSRAPYLKFFKVNSASSPSLRKLFH